MSKSGIVYVKMIITEEKILFNIEKIQKLINPKSKKQIIQLDDDVFFKDLIESVKTYLIEYPKKKNFPSSVYRAAYGLVEYATNQFEENTKNIEELIRQRESNISNAMQLIEVLNFIETKDKEWKQKVEKLEKSFGIEIVETLVNIGESEEQGTEEYEDLVKVIKSKINNLESNLHIEIDMERIEDRSKALSYIGIEIADALKAIPVPIDAFEQVVEETEEVQVKAISEVINNAVEETEQQTQIIEETVKEEVNIEQINLVQEEQNQYAEETTFTTKPSLWQRIKNSKFVNAIKLLTRIRIVIDQNQALPEGRGEQNQ